MSSTVENHLHSDGHPKARPRELPWKRVISKQHIGQLLSEDGPLSPQRRAQIRTVRGFDAASRRTAQKLIELQHGNRVVNAIISDRGRFFATLFMLDLHFRRHDEGIGLTPGRLKDLCVDQRICSATRAGALLSLMKLGGYIEPAPRRSDGRVRELVPTDRLIAQQRARWHCHLTGASAVIPEAGRALAALDDRQFFEATVRILANHFRAGFRFNDHTPAMRLFSERNGGMFVLFSLLVATQPGVSLQCQPIQVSISELARRISASRIHVLKLLRDAEAQGLLSRGEDGTVMILPPLENDIAEFFALSQLWLTYLTKTVLDHRDEAGPQPWSS